MATSHVTGVRELRRALKRANGLAPAALAAGMLEEQHHVIATAEERTPVETGVLRASGTVLPPQIAGTKVEVTAGFGGAAQDYAVVQHERLDYRHDTGQAKFLESAFIERAHVMPRTLAKSVERALKRLGH